MRELECNNAFDAVRTGSHPNEVEGPLAGTIEPENKINMENQWKDEEK